MKKLFLQPRRHFLAAPAPPTSKNGVEYGDLDTNMLIILAALLCALLFTLGINCLARWLLRCTTRFNSLAAGRGRAPATGLKRVLIHRIPVEEYGVGTGTISTDCTICLGEFMDGERIRIMPKCRHCFHVECIDIWLASHTSCPICRGPLPVERHPGGG